MSYRGQNTYYRAQSTAPPPANNAYGGYAYGQQAPPPQSQYGGAPYGHQQQQYGHYGGRPAGPPAGADPQLWEWFNRVDEDRSGAISADELRKALSNGAWYGFDLDTTKLLMNIFDTDRSGTIGFNEFAGLWKYVTEWWNVFQHYDRDRSGSIDQGELTEALKGFGYNLSPQTMRLVMTKYSSDPTIRGGPPPAITFDRFVRACVVIKTLTESFQKADTDRDGWVQLTYEHFMDLFLRAP